MQRLLLLGSSGNIGQKIHRRFTEQAWSVTPVRRDAQSSTTEVGYQAGQLDFGSAHTDPYHAVCWASGINFNDSITQFDESKHMQMYEANCLFIIRTLNQLLSENKLINGARLCIIGSIWQTLARENKLSYVVTKSALTGLVNALALDLGKQGILVNCIMPGALDTTMTRQVLTQTQISAIENQTTYRKLSNIDDVAHLAHFLCSEQNTSITSQCLAVDLGFSHAKII